jgi:hypothetical protein
MNKTAMQLLIHAIENTVIGDKWTNLKTAMLDLEREQIEKAFSDGKLSEKINHSIDPETVKRGNEIGWDFNTTPSEYFKIQFAEENNQGPLKPMGIIE